RAALAHRGRYWYAQIIRLHAALALGHADEIEAARTEFVRGGMRLTQDHFRWLPFRDKSWTAALKETGNTAFA
ncbi:MAG: hypothetical protein AAFQ51_16645, partial [Pseudomonadota bacterium]